MDQPVRLWTGARRRLAAPKGGERFPGADILFANSAEQRIILWVASDLVATAGPDIDSVDSFECERPVTELRDDVRLLDRWWTDASAHSDQLARCVAHANIDVLEARACRACPTFSGLLATCLTVS